jgi:hypothetical protein
MPIVNARSNYCMLHVIKTYADFSIAALTNSIVLFIAPPKCVVRNVKTKHSIAFSGTAITDYRVAVGVIGDTEKFSSRYDVFQAVAANTFQLSTGIGSYSHVAGTLIVATAWSVGANLNAAAGTGSVEFTIELLIM